MTEFRVGDRVECIGNWASINDTIYKKGDIDIIQGVDNLGDPQLKKSGWWYRSVFQQHFKLIERSKPMPKYDELKGRIEGVTAWDKEADDILQEIMGYENAYKIIIIQHNHDQHGEIEISEFYRGGYWGKENIRFGFNSQCEKLEAFKKVMMWFLDHSNIPKSLVNTEQKVEIEGKVYKAKIIGEV